MFYPEDSLPSPQSGYSDDLKKRFENRMRAEIFAKIISAASHDGALKTHIMYRANMSHRQLKRYLTFLEQCGLIRQAVDEETGNRLYQVTENGLEFSKVYSSLSGSLPL